MLTFYTGYAYDARSVDDLPGTLAGRATLVDKGESEGWRHVLLTSQQALLHEDRSELPPPFEYPLLFLLDNGLLIIAAEDKRVVEHVRRVQLGRTLPAKVRQAAVNVDRLVDHLLEWSAIDQESRADYPPYVLSYVHAHTIAFEPQLKSAMLYGDDIGEAGIFRTMRPLLRCAVCGIRPSDGPEVLRIGTDGSLSFAVPDRGRRVRLRLAAAAVAYVRMNGFYRYRDDNVDHR